MYNKFPKEAGIAETAALGTMLWDPILQCETLCN